MKEKPTHTHTHIHARSVQDCVQLEGSFELNKGTVILWILPKNTQPCVRMCCECIRVNAVGMVWRIFKVNKVEHFVLIHCVYHWSFRFIEFMPCLFTGSALVCVCVCVSVQRLNAKRVPNAFAWISNNFLSKYRTCKNTESNRTCSIATNIMI